MRKLLLGLASLIVAVGVAVYAGTAGAASADGTLQATASVAGTMAISSPSGLQPVACGAVSATSIDCAAASVVYTLATNDTWGYTISATPTITLTHATEADTLVLSYTATPAGNATYGGADDTLTFDPTTIASTTWKPGSYTSGVVTVTFTSNH